MQSSLERIDPDKLVAEEATGQETLRLHLARYEYAARFLVKGNCADIACGIGYGSFLLATQYGDLINQIVAVDIDKASIELARTRYQHPQIDFLNGDALDFQSPFPLQMVISLETIEHLPHPHQFIRNLAAQLEPGGRFVASVPITPSMDANPYHLHDFTRTSFIKMFTDAGFHLVDSLVQVQPYQLFSVLGKKEERSKDLRRNLIGYYVAHPSKLLLRLKSLLRDGFTNKYLVGVFEKS